MLRRNQKIELLKKVPLFALCTNRELAEIATLADEVDLRAGKELIREGSRGREFFVLLEGRADVTKNGRRINRMGAGEFFGEIALIARLADPDRDGHRDDAGARARDHGAELPPAARTLARDQAEGARGAGRARRAPAGV